MVIVLGFAAFTIDVGYIALTKNQLQNAVDAAALAGALELNPLMDQDDVDAAVRQAAVDVAALNRAGDHDAVFVDSTTDIQLGRRTWDAQAQTYDYAFGPTAIPYNIVKVSALRKEIEIPLQGGTTMIEDRRLPLFFAPAIGHGKAGLETTAVATFQPRDMMLVLDYSASMNDDSELRSIYSLGLLAVKDMIQQMWQDLGSPTYGNLQFEPDWVTVPGQPASGPVPHIDVTWRTDKVDIVSTKDLSNVVLKFSDGRTQKFDGLSGYTGTFQGTGSNSGKRIVTVWVKSGKNASGDGPGYGEKFDFYDNATIIRGLGLDSVPYPYPSGSWSNYVDYARNHSSSMPWYDRDVYQAGYRRKFGMLTLINFWNLKKPLHSQTPDLWMASQQPITALKDATDLLLDYLTDVEAEDQVGLSVYTYPQGDGAKLESPLTIDFDLIKALSRQRQAGHYDYYTNIGAGMRTARQELESNARPKAFRMMVLITDGIANRSSTGASPGNFALNEADLAADVKIKIMTISLGVNADTNLMQEIADRTGGIHFNVPGGSTVEEYEQQLKDVFAEIAADRPLKLIPVPGL